MLFEDLALNRVVMEFRYDEGHLYWDKCGETINNIQKDYPEWQWSGTSTELAKLKNIHRNMELEFNYRYIRFIQVEVENLSKFKSATEEIVPLITDKFDIKTFKRIGNRFQYVFPVKNPAEGKEIVHNCPFIQIPENKLALFGQNSEKTSFLVRIENDNTQYRLELQGIERESLPKNITVDDRFNPKYGLLVDVDIAIITEVKVADFNFSDFVQSNKKFLEHNLVKFIEK